jgi:hypothetical protein
MADEANFSDELRRDFSAVNRSSRLSSPVKAQATTAVFVMPAFNKFDEDIASNRLDRAFHDRNVGATCLNAGPSTRGTAASSLAV